MLSSLDSHLPKCTIMIAREITNQFEEFVKGTPSELLKYFNDNKVKQKGEFVVIVSPK